MVRLAERKWKSLQNHDSIIPAGASDIMGMKETSMWVKVHAKLDKEMVNSYSLQTSIDSASHSVNKSRDPNPLKVLGANLMHRGICWWTLGYTILSDFQGVSNICWAAENLSSGAWGLEGLRKAATSLPLPNRWSAVESLEALQYALKLQNYYPILILFSVHYPWILDIQ